MTPRGATAGAGRRWGRPAPPFLVLVEPTGGRGEAQDAEGAVDLARRLLAEAREAADVPRANFYANGTLVRAGVTRTDLATELGRCWCGRGSLYGKPGAGWCSPEHEVLWRQWDDDLRARTIAARFLHIMGQRGPRVRAAR